MRGLVIFVLVLGLGACAIPSGDNQEEQSPTEDDSVEEKPVEDEDTDEEDHSNHDSGEIEDQDSNDNQAESVKEIRKEIKEKITSDFKVKLPSEIDTKDENHLSATVDSDALYYEVAYYETDEQMAINDALLTQETLFMIVKGTAYDSTAEANEQVGYQPIQEGMPEVDLGNGITGYQDAGAGSSFITWHEGRWSFTMRSRNEEKGIAAGEKLAKDIVEKLEEKTLPPPHENGAGILSSADNDDVETNRLAWQEENIVYEVYMSDALSLIDVVTEEF